MGKRMFFSKKLNDGATKTLSGLTSCLIWDKEMWVKEREMHVNKFGNFYQCKIMFKNFRFLWRFPSKHRQMSEKETSKTR